MKTHHYIYETTNKIDGKKYIGRRSTNNNPYEDTYLGSGKVLKRAINKYGRENFTKNIICLCNSFCELKVMEENILRLYDVASDQMYYNLNNSSSGFDYGENNVMKQPEISVKVAGEKNGNYGKGLFGSNNGNYGKGLFGYDNGFYNKHHSEETIKYLSEINSGVNSHNYGKPAWNTGIPNTKETNQKISEGNSGKVRTEEARQNYSNAKMGVKFKKEKCKYCNALIGINNINRYHNEKCKYKINF